MSTVPHTNVAIIGTGFAGLGTAIRLKEEGIDDFLLFERAGDIGGTWRDNSYPGCACDVPSNLYSFSYELNPEWRHSFSRQPQIFAYLKGVAAKHDLLPRTRLDHELLGADWDADAQRWTLETTQGEYTADVVVAAVGGLSDPSYPDIEGLEDFEGPVFHSAQWDHDAELAGKRVAVVGTGASAIQFVPEIQPQVAHLDLYQRTPPWIIPRRDRPITGLEHRLFRRLPALQRAVREGIYWAREGFVIGFRNPWIMRLVEKVAVRHMEGAVEDEALRDKLRPDYRLGCKRILISNDYYPALAAGNVDVVTARVARATPTGLVDSDGVERPADAVVLGTGFKVYDLPVSHRVRDAEGRTLAERWHGVIQAHLGTMVAGFPNLFFLLGPNTGLGHTSVVYMIEAQVQHIVDALGHLRRTGGAEIEVTADAQERFNARVQEKTQGTVWTTGGCSSWYLDSEGRNTTLWPTFTKPFDDEARRFVAGDHEVRPRRTREPAPV